MTDPAAAGLPANTATKTTTDPSGAKVVETSVRPLTDGNNKALATGGVGALLVIIVWALNTYVTVAHPIPGEIVAAIGMVLQTAATYFVPHGGNS